MEIQSVSQFMSDANMNTADHALVDPDLSNPTRRRLERPLETIMSFEAAIDREYRRQREANRQSIIVQGIFFVQKHAHGIILIACADSGQDGGGWESRRSSSYWGK